MKRTDYTRIAPTYDESAERHELQQLGFSVRTRIRVRLIDTPARDLLERARRRDMSSIAVVSDECYAAGLAQLEALAAQGASVAEEGALLLCEALPGDALSWQERP